MSRKRVLVASVGLATALAIAIAPMAQAYTYWVSPYFTHDVSSYAFGPCNVGAKGAGTKNLTVFVVNHNSCYMDMIGGRAVDSAGNSTAITWDTARVDVVHLYRSGGVSQYKMYRTYGDI